MRVTLSPSPSLHMTYLHVIILSKKGGLGDCWFLAVIAAAGDVPGLIQSVAIDIHEQAKV